MLSRRIARLYAVQILYQMDYVLSDLNLAIDTFLNYYQRSELPRADIDLLRKLVFGTAQKRQEIIAEIEAIASRPSDRIEQLLRIILEVAGYEILYLKAAPAKAVISEYVTIAAGFFTSGEPDFVNGILEKLAARAQEDGALELKGDSAPSEATAETTKESTEEIASPGSKTASPK